jgi:hypothetical protein
VTPWLSDARKRQKGFLVNETAGRTTTRTWRRSGRLGSFLDMKDRKNPRF